MNEISNKDVAAINSLEILLEKGMINQATYTNIMKTRKLADFTGGLIISTIYSEK